MSFETSLINRLFTMVSEDFEALALDCYRFQAEHVAVYRDFHRVLGRRPETVSGMAEIPFLPISFFKSHRVISDKRLPEQVFESSGTTGMTPSRHFVADTDVYKSVSLQIFREHYGDPKDWTILALLPSYLERGNSSLVYMVDMLMRDSSGSADGYYLNQFERLAQELKELCRAGKKVLLFGVTFALLDFAEAYPMDLPGCVIIETGGMKGRGTELTRVALHQRLCAAWPGARIHSEYGMTELLSQAYAPENGVFIPGFSMRAFVREVHDPLSCAASGTGVLNIIDLANIYSCSFIATEDLCRVHDNGHFEVLGRLDFAALRGCSLLSI